MAAAALIVLAQLELARPKTHAALGRALGLDENTAVGPVIDAPRVVPAEAFDDVRDNAPFRSAEDTAWFATLASARAAVATPTPRVGYAQLASQPSAYRGKAVSVRGTLRRVEEVTPAANDRGIERLWRATLEPEGTAVWPLTVYTFADPAAEGLAVGAPVAACGVFFKNLSYRWEEGMGITPVVVAARLQSPDAIEDASQALAGQGQPTAVTPEGSLDPPVEGSMGRALLAQLGVNLARLDAVADRGSLSAEESDPFYAVLDAVAKTPATQLVRLARSGLADYASRQAVAAGADRPRRLVADEVARQALEGRYAVAPLFGDGAAQRGELVVMDAVVRRVVRVEVEPTMTIDHYYELEAFPEDSQNLPLVFCVRGLPAGFPVGEDVRQPARLAGFFFKQWAYRTRRRGAGEDDLRQFAPLLVGRAPIPLAAPATRGDGFALAAGLGGATLALAAAAWAWRQARDARRYEAATLRRLHRPEAPDFSSLG